MDGLDYLSGWHKNLNSNGNATAAICEWLGDELAKAVQSYDESVEYAGLLDDYDNKNGAQYRFVVAYTDEYVTYDANGITAEPA